MSITKDCTFAAMAGEKYKVALRRLHLGVHSCIQKFFFPRTVPQWNDLDKETAEGTTINCFKRRLH